jgi:hypothetical protein
VIKEEEEKEKGASSGRGGESEKPGRCCSPNERVSLHAHMEARQKNIEF